MVHIPKYIYYLSAFGTGFGCIVLVRSYVGIPKYEGNERIPGRTVIVTGANCGIGKAAAMEFAKRGAKVIMACRDLDKCNEARDDIIHHSYNKNVLCKHLDLSSLSSIRQFANDINNEKRLHILVNNAGVLTNQRSLTIDGFELQLGVNYLGPFLLTNLLLDKLKESAPSRIINVSCPAYSRGTIDFADFNKAKNFDSVAAYRQSKLALLMFSRKLADDLKGSRVNVYVADPGVCKTDLSRNFSAYQSAVVKVLMAPFWWLFLHNPDEGARVILYCALEPALAFDSGKLYSSNKEEDVIKEAKDTKLGARLWALSKKWTRFNSKVDSLTNAANSSN